MPHPPPPPEGPPPGTVVRVAPGEEVGFSLRAPGAGPAGLTGLRLAGFRSFRDPVEIELRGLTVLAGANSSGKSSALLPLLLLKQTLESAQDPGPLLLHGDLVRIRDAGSLFWSGRAPARELEIGVRSGDGWATTRLGRGPRGRVEVLSTQLGEVTLRPDLDKAERIRAWGPDAERLAEWFDAHPPQVRRDRTFMTLVASLPLDGGHTVVLQASPAPVVEIRSVLHLPGLRGAPEPYYPPLEPVPWFPGRFPPYTASVLRSWQENEPDQLALVAADLRRLGVAGHVETRSPNAAEIEVHVSRLRGPRASRKDLVNLADVGLGVSQVLPVVVALRVARPEQLVHVEQPELHLHPDAQIALADLLLDAVDRGVRVVVETHSSALLKALQVRVAEETADPARIALHWFSRDAAGVSRVTTGALDPDGAYGDWPVDFSEVELGLEARFLRAPLRRRA